MDQGGDFGFSYRFQNKVASEKNTLDTTGADVMAQNMIAESPNKYLWNMMRSMLHAADLGLEYWFFVLLYAMYVKNIPPHELIKKTHLWINHRNKTKYHKLTIIWMQIFVRKPGIKPAKLDRHTSNGMFVGYTATTKTI